MWTAFVNSTDVHSLYWPSWRYYCSFMKKHNCGRSFYIIYHPTSNMLPHYLTKFVYSTVHLTVELCSLKVCKIAYFQ